MPRAADRAYDELRIRISSGALEPGERLREENLAEGLGFSRTPVREALRRLHAEGLVEFVPHRGAHVTSWSSTDLEEIFGLRALLEGHSAALAAAAITEEQVTTLASSAERMAEVAAHARPNVAQLSALNGEFHRGVLDAAGSPRLTGMVNGLVQLPLVQVTFRRYDPAALRRSAAHHLELVAALRARDAGWAESVMHAHVRAALSSLREQVREDAAADRDVS